MNRGGKIMGLLIQNHHHGQGRTNGNNSGALDSSLDLVSGEELVLVVELQCVAHEQQRLNHGESHQYDSKNQNVLIDGCY